MDTKTFFDWYQELEHDEEYLAENLKVEFAVDIEHMMVRHNITKSALAKQIDTSPAYITKVLRGDANMTIETMTKLSCAVGATLHIHVAPRSSKIRWSEIIDGGKKTTDIVSATVWANRQRKLRQTHATG
jgi:transcriptional regulator with XRE-family HTH domain